MAKTEFKLRETELFDIRTVNRHIASGLVGQDAYDERLSELEDCADNAVESTVHFVYSRDAPEQEVIITAEMLAAQRSAANREAAEEEEEV
jgi:hypothetical protein